MDAFPFKYSIITSAKYLYLTLVLKFKSTKTEININVHTINAVKYIIYCIYIYIYIVNNSENPRSLQLATRIYKNYMRKRIKHVKRSESGELQR